MKPTDRDLPLWITLPPRDYAPREDRTKLRTERVAGFVINLALFVLAGCAWYGFVWFALCAFDAPP